MEKYKKLRLEAFSTFDQDQKKYSNGILKLHLKSWEEFHEIVKIFDNNPDYIWRGQENDYPLQASFDSPRDDKPPIYHDKSERDVKLKELLTNFKRRLDDLPDKQNLSENEIWAIGQHYGLPTPFLDWTKSPYIASYFAFYKDEPKTDRAIFALNRATHRLISKKIKKPSRKVISKDPFIEFIDLSEDRVDNMRNERLKKQKGNFTKALNGIEIKKNVIDLYDKAYKSQEVLLAEILIPAKFRAECLDFLKSKNITHGELFPDYRGAVEMCKIESSILNKNQED